MAKRPRTPPTKRNIGTPSTTAATPGPSRATKRPARKKVTGTGVDARRVAAASDPVRTSPEPRGALADTRSKEAIGQPAEMARERDAVGESQDRVPGVTEEQKEVGKREIETARTAVGRSSVERPEEKQADGDEEHRDLIREAVEDPNLPSRSDDDWTDRTILVIETREEAIVSKKVRVTEEITLRKNETERVETIRDSVRKQEVQIERIDKEGRLIRDGVPRPGTGH